MHDLLQDHGSSSAGNKLVDTAPNFYSAHRAMRTHAARQISAKPEWGATSEMAIQNAYEILDSDGRAMLHYEIDAIFLVDGDPDGTQVWERASEMPVPPVHYGMYVDFNCDDKDRVEHFFIGGFQSLGEAVHSMKLAAKSTLPHHHGVSLFHQTIELLDEKGLVRQRYTVVKGMRNENGNFVKEADWDREQAVVTTPKLVSTGFGKPVLRLPTPVGQEKPSLQPFQLLLSQARHRVQNPDPATSLSTAAHPTSQPAQAPQLESGERHHEVYCVCRLPDDGSFMVACGNKRCPIEWYHGRCVDIQHADVVDEQWYCEMCLRQQQDKKVRHKGRTPAKTPAKKNGGARRAKAKNKKRKSS